MNTPSAPLTDSDVERLIDEWETARPIEPAIDEPLFVWSNGGIIGTIQYFVRLWIYERRMRKSGWRSYRLLLEEWYRTITKEYNLLADGRDTHYHPRLRKLWDYLNSVKPLLRENTISQAERNCRRQRK